MEQIIEDGSLIELIHYTYFGEPPAPTKMSFTSMRRRWMVACMPGLVELHSAPGRPAIQRTGELGPVNCPACKSSVAYRNRLAGA